MTVSIITKYVGPTNYKPSRIIASTMSDKPVRLTVSYEYKRGNLDHVDAAKALIAKLGWGGKWYIGDTHSGIVCVAAENVYETAGGGIVGKPDFITEWDHEASAKLRK